ncbi:MAG: peptidylprolyl isomerase, partial [Planctomycetaceae bacterium]|nr:peptidylprolyl isomerase [Planctomycetaceae bacterium]
MKITTLSNIKRLQLTVLLLTASFSCSFQSTASAEEALLDRIAAVVENDVITENEVLERLNVIYAQASSPSSLPPRNVLTEQVLQRMIIERLQVQRAERLGITIDNLSLDQAMRNLADRNGLSLEGFHDTLVRQGINYDDFREQVKNEMIIGQLRQRVVDSAVEVSEKEIDELIAGQQDQLNQNVEYQISHILVSLPEAPTSDEINTAKSKVEDLHEKAVSGQDFEQLATANSDASDALEGGDLGWRQRTQVPGIFVRELDSMEPGEISPVIR